VTLIGQLREDVVDKSNITDHLSQHFDQFNGARALFEVPKVIEE
jgi:hypothetical protein